MGASTTGGPLFPGGTGGGNTLEGSAGNHSVLLPGMRREWHFTLHFRHASARVQLFCPPHWEPTFIEPERLKGLHTLDRDAKHCPLTPALRFLDPSVPPPSGVGAGGANGAGAPPDSPEATGTMNPSLSPGGAEGMEDFGGGGSGMYGGGKRITYDDGQRGGMGVLQNGKVVELLYSHIPPSMTLAAFCCRSVQHVLNDPHVIAVDNDKRLRRLRVGKKLSSCPYRLGGERSFHFYYYVQQKTELLTHDVCYCVGTILGQRGYLLTVRGTDQESLDAYVLHLLMPYMCNPLHTKLNVAVEYMDDPRGNTSVVPSPALWSGGGGGGGGLSSATASPTSLSSLQGGAVGNNPFSPFSFSSPYRGVGVAGWGRGASSNGRGKGYTPLPSTAPAFSMTTHPGTAAAGGGGGVPLYPSAHRPQEDYGEIRYEDQDAAISFSLALRPLRFRPDFSPTKTVGVGSIACMTLELNLFESLIDDEAVAEVTGMPKYKMNQVLLCLEVEDVARMNYPGVMTTSEYAELKTNRLLDGLSDAKVVGTSTFLLIGPRIGSNHIITFQYEPFNGLAKAMYVSTLVGNFGVTAYYLTKLGGGYFESHLHLFNELLRRLEYLPQHRDNITFSRFDVVNVRLLETELYRCYSGAAAQRKEAFQAHLNSLAESNDGQAEGAVVVAVAEEDGGYVEKGVGEVGWLGAGRVSAVGGGGGGGGGSPAPGAGTPISPATSHDPKRRSSAAVAADTSSRAAPTPTKDAADAMDGEEEEAGGGTTPERGGPPEKRSPSRAGASKKITLDEDMEFPAFSPTMAGVLGKTAFSPLVEGKGEALSDWVDDREEVFSSHSRSLITVSSLTHLPMLLIDDEEEEEERNMEEEEEEEEHVDDDRDERGGGIKEEMLAFLRQAGEPKKREADAAPLLCEEDAMEEEAKRKEEKDEEEETEGLGEASPRTDRKENDAFARAEEVEEEEGRDGGVAGTSTWPPGSSSSTSTTTTTTKGREAEEGPTGGAIPSSSSFDPSPSSFLPGSDSIGEERRRSSAKAGTEAFSHPRFGEAMMERGTWVDPPNGNGDDEEKSENENENENEKGKEESSHTTARVREDEDNGEEGDGVRHGASLHTSTPPEITGKKQDEGSEEGQKKTPPAPASSRIPPSPHPLFPLLPSTTSALSPFSVALFPPPRRLSSPSPPLEGAAGGGVVVPPPLGFEKLSGPSLLVYPGLVTTTTTTTTTTSTAAAAPVSTDATQDGKDGTGAATAGEGHDPSGEEKEITMEEKKGVDGKEAAEAAGTSTTTTTSKMMVGGVVVVPTGWKPSPLPIPDRTVAPTTTSPSTTSSPSASPVRTLPEGGAPNSVERTKQLLTGPAVSAVLATISPPQSTPCGFSSPSPSAASSASHPSHALASPSSTTGAAALPTVKDLYLHCCADAQCKPNSHLLERLPITEGREGSAVIEELDMSGNYVGHSGFAAVLRFLEYLPCLTQVYFNNMTLDNTDVEKMCMVLATHPTVQGVHIRNNPSITLVSTKHLHALLRQNKNIRRLSLQGTRLGEAVIAKLEAKAAESR